jgi:hypothetical protein
MILLKNILKFSFLILFIPVVTIIRWRKYLPGFRKYLPGFSEVHYHGRYLFISNLFRSQIPDPLQINTICDGRSSSSGLFLLWQSWHRKIIPFVFRIHWGHGKIDWTQCLNVMQQRDIMFFYGDLQIPALGVFPDDV